MDLGFPVIGAAATGPFAPSAIHDSIQTAIQQQGLTIPSDKRGVIATSFDGTTLHATTAIRIGREWTAGTELAWHGAAPSVGVFIHGSF